MDKNSILFIETSTKLKPIEETKSKKVETSLRKNQNNTTNEKIYNLVTR